MRRIAVLITLAMALAAGQAAKADPAGIAANRTLYDQIHDGKVADVLAQMPPNANTPATVAAVTRLGSLIPPGAPRSSTVVANPSAETVAGHAQAVVAEYDYADRTTRFETAFQQPKGKTGLSLRSFRMQVATHKELQPNALSVANKSLPQLVYLALAVASPLLMIAALIKVLRTRGLANKGLWAAFSLVGLFGFEMNWANGSVLVDWMSLRIIGFWMASSPSAFDPWIISATVPIGAMLILAGLVAKPAKA
jgi:hypothetical protein